MIAIARLIPVVAMLPVAFGYGSMGIGTAGAEDKRAEENCLAAPNTLAPQGSHWYYRTDHVKQRKCWYLRTTGPAIQEQAAQEQPETGVTARSPTPNTAPDQSGSEPLELRPAEAPSPALVAKPTKGDTQDRAQASRPAGVGQAAEPPSPARAGQVARPDPPSAAGTSQVAWPQPPAPAATGQAAWPQPPSPAGTSQVAWPQPPALAATGQVAWPDPPPAARADKVAWPAPPSPGSGVTGAGGENAPKETARQTQEAPATASISAKGARNDVGADKPVAKPNPSGSSQGEMRTGLLLALAIGLILAGILVRWIVRMTLTRRPTVYLDRQEPVWATSNASQGTISATQHPGLNWVDIDRLDDEVKQALPKLLRALNLQAETSQAPSRPW